MLHKALAVVTFVLASVSATAATATPLMLCTELTEGGSVLSVESTTNGVELQIDGRTQAIPGTAARGVYNFIQGQPLQPGFLSLEIKRVNGEYIGVMFEPTVHGPGAFDQSIFRCLEVVVGAISSNG